LILPFTAATGGGRGSYVGWTNEGGAVGVYNEVTGLAKGSSLIDEACLLASLGAKSDAVLIVMLDIQTPFSPGTTAEEETRNRELANERPLERRGQRWTT
jgi:hypothetical protein